MENTKTLTVPSIGKFLQAGLVAGLISLVLANIYSLIYSSVTGNTFAELNVVTISIVCLITCLIGSAIYYGLTRFTAQATPIFVVVGLVVAVLSGLPQFISPLYPNFGPASAPMHLIVGVVCVLVVPAMVKARS